MYRVPYVTGAELRSSLIDKLLDEQLSTFVVFAGCRRLLSRVRVLLIVSSET